ncbi:MAG TPA: hypothetical protein DCE56_32895 [Cyanobacteria bacterium UBA8553]|nr:hypothetical protein [Cyanobacteria bacterium UBA8553]HAJ61293.1 hypothetical protein [Cyanobacteria bacterium UBA8543]
MVERPIKKSERQVVAPSSDVGEPAKEKGRPIEKRLDSTNSEERSAPRSFQKKERSKGRGKGNQQESGPAPVNPALMRGPKPTKPKPPVIQETPEATSEDSVTETPEETSSEE